MLKSLSSTFILVLIINFNASATVLGDAANAMAAQSWRPLSTEGLINDMLHTGPVMDVVFAYSNDGCWDPGTGQVLYIGGPHYAPMRFNIYKDETNTWRQGNFPSGSFLSHSYDNLTIDNNGNFYFFQNGNVYVYNAPQDKWVNTFSGPPVSSRYGSLEYFPEMNALIYVYAGGVYKRSLTGGSWSTLGTGLTMANLHNLAEYNPKHKCVVFGGGNGHKSIYKLDTQGNITKLKDAPVVYNTHGTLMTTDPVSNEIVFISNDSVYSYDIGTETGKVVTRSFVGTYSSVGSTALIKISTYGVIMLISDGSFPVLLYKHTDSGSRIDRTPEVEFNKITAFPNPFKPTTTIRANLQCGDKNVLMEIFNAAGQRIEQRRVRPDDLQSGITWHARGIPSGMYMVRLTSGIRQYRKNLLFLK